MKKIGIAVVVTFLALLVFSGKLEGYFFKKENIGKVKKGRKEKKNKKPP